MMIGLILELLFTSQKEVCEVCLILCLSFITCPSYNAVVMSTLYGGYTVYVLVVYTYGEKCTSLGVVTPKVKLWLGLTELCFDMQDFSTRSLVMSEESPMSEVQDKGLVDGEGDVLEQYQLRRTWENRY